MLDITTPPGAPPRDLLDEAMRELHGQVSMQASAGSEPPNLELAIRRAETARDMDNVADLVVALRDIAHAALDLGANLERAPEQSVREALDDMLRELRAQIAIFASRSTRPPQLGPSISLAAVARRGQDPAHTSRKLRDVAHAAVATIVRVRAVDDHEPSP